MKRIIAKIASKEDEGRAKFIDSLPKPEEVAPPVADPEKDLSIDTELAYGLYCIHKIMQSVRSEAVSGLPSREAVQNLKDCMTMLHELKKKEDDVLEDLSDDDLAKIASGD